MTPVDIYFPRQLYIDALLGRTPELSLNLVNDKDESGIATMDYSSKMVLRSLSKMRTVGECSREELRCCTRCDLWHSWHAPCL